jgi:hypothetical protein
MHASGMFDGASSTHSVMHVWTVAGDALLQSHAAVQTSVARCSGD